MAAFLLVATATALALYPLCAVLHLCGCVAPWWGGAASCNVHVPGPHCPWCEYPALGAAATITILAGQGAAFWRWWKPRRSILAGFLASALALLPSVVAAGAVLWLLTDYPHFLALDARGRLAVPSGPLKCVSKPAAATPCCGGSR
jgi:hypothetical protein